MSIYYQNVLLKVEVILHSQQTGGVAVDMFVKLTRTTLFMFL